VKYDGDHFPAIVDGLETDSICVENIFPPLPPSHVVLFWHVACNRKKDQIPAYTCHVDTKGKVPVSRNMEADSCSPGRFPDDRYGRRSGYERRKVLKRIEFQDQRSGKDRRSGADRRSLIIGRI